MFTCGTNTWNREQAKWAHLVCLGSQSECRICFIFPTSGFSHIMKRFSGQLREVVADKNWVTGGPFREEVLIHLGDRSFITSQRGVGVFRKVIITYKNCTPLVPSLCSYAELQESSISCLSWSFVKEFAVSSYRWSYAQLCLLTQDKSTKLWEPWHILEDRIGVDLVKFSAKVCGFTFGSISLHLINKRIKEILTQKHQYNAKYLSRFNDKNACRK